MQRKPQPWSGCLGFLGDLIFGAFGFILGLIVPSPRDQQRFLWWLDNRLLTYQTAITVLAVILPMATALAIYWATKLRPGSKD
jgi:hypothetical protein